MRLQQLAEHQLARQLQSLEAALVQLKTAQFIGTGAVSFFLGDSGAPYDWSGTLTHTTATASGYVQALLLTVECTNQEFATGDVIAELYVGSMANRYTYANWLDDLAHSRPAFSLSVYPVAGSPAAPTTATWKVFVQGGSNTTTCYVKFYIVANDDVNITVVTTTTI